MEPESSTLAGGFFTTGPLGKSFFCYSWFCVPSASFTVRLTFVKYGHHFGSMGSKGVLDL